ncbi:MAG: hypothetical protein JXB05_13655 [Myxococcaceae bacterium]|nr:hypothetical protein [Myxococcaceae bacterium]
MAAMAGLGVPAVLAIVAWALAGSPVRAMLAIVISTLLNTPSPLGGGMGAQGITRVRWACWERTFDMDRGVGEAVAGAFLLSAVTAGSFLIAAPWVAAVLRWVGPLRPGIDELLALAATGVLVVLSVVLHQPELPLRQMRARFQGEGERLAPEELARAVQQLSRIAREDGAFGHVGGIGAKTVGLHEHLDAEALLRLSALHGAPGAAALHAQCLAHLLSRAEPGGGFSAYPSGLPRVEYTARALEALAGRLDEASTDRHRAAVLACRREDGRFGRSVNGPASEESTTWGRRCLDEP